MLDPLFLSRLQWAWVIGWHILLPAFTVGMASFIAVLEGLFFFTGNGIWMGISRLGIRIFAVAFGMGVVTGIVMPFQFGTNWSRFLAACMVALGTLMSSFWILAANSWMSGWGGDAALFAAAMGLFLMSYLGIAISLWPMIIPHHYTLWQAASSPSTQAFLMIGTLVLLPVILMYTA
jgi:cytochrome bd-type quinol oxidase subunit 1